MVAAVHILLRMILAAVNAKLFGFNHLFHGARYFVANRLFHKVIVLFGLRLCNCPLRLSLTWMLYLHSIDSGWAQGKTGDASGANAQAEDLLDLRGDLPNPRRIDASELHRMPRVEARITDPHNPGKEIVYSGTPLMEVLKAGGLLPESLRQRCVHRRVLDVAHRPFTHSQSSDLNKSHSDRRV